MRIKILISMKRKKIINYNINNIVDDKENNNREVINESSYNNGDNYSKNNNNESSIKNHRKRDELHFSKMDIESGQNEESARLKVSLRNSKNYSLEMENKVNKLKNSGNYLQFKEIEVNDKIQEEIEENNEEIKNSQVNKISFKKLRIK